jgi:arginase
MEGLMKTLCLIVLACLLVPTAVSAQSYTSPEGALKVALVKMPYTGARNVAELSDTPNYLEQGGLERMLADGGVMLKPISTVELTSEEQRDYGEWHRLGLANGHLAEIIAANREEGYLSVGLLANCSSLMGMLGGFQHSGATRRPLRVGLVFVDAHGDFNTPETTLSGMLGGMPVAVSAGMALTNLRLKSGLDPALPTRYIVMAALRDTDPLEQELIDRSEIEHITVDDIRDLTPMIDHQVERLSRLTDVIYIHIDMDVLDPSEVQGHSLNVPNGPTSLELAAALTEMFEYEKVAGLGIASTPSFEDDPGGKSLKAAYNLIEGALEGVRRRSR